MNKNQKWKTRAMNEIQEPKVKFWNKEWITKTPSIKESIANEHESGARTYEWKSRRIK
jgi:hypothetical protein